MRGPSRLVCLAGLLAGCLPNEAPFWLIDHPVTWGIKISVTRPGGYSTGLIVPPGQVRASALPLDTIELEWLTLAPEGTELAPPIWIRCPNTCDFDLTPDELPACPEPTPLQVFSMCRLGEGHRLPLVLAGAKNNALSGSMSVMAIGSADPELSPETCLQRLVTEPKRDLASCLMIFRAYAIGQSVPGGLPDPSGPFDPPGPDDPPDVPPQIADTHPTVEGFWVTAPGGERLVPVGSEVRVKPGLVAIEAELAQDAEQTFFYPVPSGAGYMWVQGQEIVQFRAASSGWVERWEYFGAERRIEIVVQEGLEPFELYFYFADSRQGRATATLRIVPEDMSKTP